MIVAVICAVGGSIATLLAPTGSRSHEHHNRWLKGMMAGGLEHRLKPDRPDLRGLSSSI
jgi:hypothetical protein